MLGVNVLPHEEQVIGTAMLEKWDYCLRKLFVLKGHTLKASIGYVIFPNIANVKHWSELSPFSRG